MCFSGCGTEDDNEVAVSSSAVTVTAVEDLDEDLEIVQGAVALTSASAAAMDDDGVLVQLDTDEPDPRPMGITDCRDVTASTEGIRVNFDACPYAQGNVTFERMRLGIWLLTFEDDFQFTNVDVDGHVLLERQEPGDYDVYTADESGGSRGVAAVRLTWQGLRRPIVRDVVLSGGLGVIDQPLVEFSLVGEGAVRDVGGLRVSELGIGGPVGSAKDSPARFTRPVERRCPNGGKVELHGPFVCVLDVTVSFEVARREYELEVTVEASYPDALIVEFDVDEAQGPEPVAAASVVGAPVTVPEDVILAALDARAWPRDISEAIRNNVREALPWVPVALLQQNVQAALAEAFGEDGICGAGN